ncbi:hypothetical protein NDU88_004504 [Pleurodeles waltl]|uniref:Uncharacterized protein n=1 Tax=Pleurodeles waltl TaxID=8319 RepID=A0AAV7TS37_PLEWA|nr:hypothetical protein NDU88_004504 [Pleurodeles waltl]
MQSNLGAENAPAALGRAAPNSTGHCRAPGLRRRLVWGRSFRLAPPQVKAVAQRSRGRSHVPLLVPVLGHRRSGPVGSLVYRAYPRSSGGAPVAYGTSRARIMIKEGGP